jgi:hypothetical protein
MSPTEVWTFGDLSAPPKLDHYRVTQEEWKEAQENDTRTKVIGEDALFHDVLGHLITSALSPKDDVLETLLNSMELNDRARLAYVLRHIEKRTMQDLHRIHNIRNKWAHLAKPTFSAKEWKRDVLSLSTVGNKKDKVTAKNYMDFFWAAAQDCRTAILDAMKRVTPTYMQIVEKLIQMKSKPADVKFIVERAKSA